MNGLQTRSLSKRMVLVDLTMRTVVGVQEARGMSEVNLLDRNGANNLEDDET